MQEDEKNIDELTAKIMAEFGYPPSLAKACWDPYSYAAWLRDGSVVFFEIAETISKQWVKLWPTTDEGKRTGFRGQGCCLGIEVQLSEIAVVADARHKLRR